MAHGTRFSEAELERMAAEAAEGDALDEVGEDGWSVDDGAQATGTTSMSIRLPVAMVAALKAAAEAQGVGATVLARQWIMERLAAGGAGVQGTVAVADLLALVFEGAQVSARPAKKSPRAAKSSKPQRASATKRSRATRPRRDDEAIKGLEVSYNRD